LVEYLDYDSGRRSNGAANTFNTNSDETAQRNSHIKVLIPSRAQTPSHRAGGICLIGVDGDDGEWVRETEELSLHKRVGGKDWAQMSCYGGADNHESLTSDSDGLCLVLIRHLEQPPGVLVSSLDWECRKRREQRKRASQVEVEVERSLLERYAVEMAMTMNKATSRN
jgi:hypothetical protein